MPRDHYRVLAVAPDATTEEIERSFRQLARRLHPDRNDGDGAALEMMKELNIARAALTDPTSRAAYDEQLRRERRAKSPPQSAPPPLARPSSPAPESKPLVSWMGTRSTPPPRPRPELSKAADVSRLFWLTFTALAVLAVVIGLILLGQAVRGVN